MLLEYGTHGLSVHELPVGFPLEFRREIDPSGDDTGDIRTGTEFCKFSVASDRYNGKEKVADFFDCTAFGAKGVAISKFFQRGQDIVVVGEMTSNRVEKDGGKVTYWGVAVRDFDFGGGGNNQGTASAPAPAPDGFTALASDPEGLPF